MSVLQLRFRVESDNCNNQLFALYNFYTQRAEVFVFWVMQLVLVDVYRRFGTVPWSHLQDASTEISASTC